MGAQLATRPLPSSPRPPSAPLRRPRPPRDHPSQPTPQRFPSTPPRPPRHQSTQPRPPRAHPSQPTPQRSQSTPPRPTRAQSSTQLASLPCLSQLLLTQLTLLPLLLPSHTAPVTQLALTQPRTPPSHTSPTALPQ